jgi:hypothetical protein
MGWESDVATGFAQAIAAAGAGTFDPTGTGGSIVIGPLPPDTSPGVGITTYRAGADDPKNPTTRLRVQFWLRAPDAATLNDLDSAVYDAIQGLHAVTMGAATVSDCGSFASVPMGIDGNGNLERAAHYLADLSLPDTALRSYT